MAAPRSSLAAQYRQHRLAFSLALELGCTPKEAAEEMRRREAHEKWRAGMDRLEARIKAGIAGTRDFDTSGTGPGGTALRQAQGERDQQPWMMRD